MRIIGHALALAACITALGCNGAPAPEGRGDEAPRPDAAAPAPSQPAAAAPEAAAPAPADREQQERRVAELYPEVVRLMQGGGSVEDLKRAAAELDQLIQALTKRSKDDPEYQLAAEAVLLEATRKYAPDLHQALIESKQMEAAQKRQSAITLTNLKLVEAAAAVERFKAANGHPPDDLSQLDRNYFDPAGAKDAWGNAFIYERRGDAYALGAVGPDGKRGTADDQDAAVAMKAIRLRERKR